MKKRLFLTRTNSALQAEARHLIAMHERKKWVERTDFSVSMCVYGKDNPVHFDVALMSVINQTTKPTEIVLTVDGPIPEKIEKIIEKYQKNLSSTNIQFKVIRLKRNMGHGEARRICFENCTCNMIALMDADDLSVSTRFEKQVSYFSCHPEVAIVGGYITEFFTTEDPTDVSKTAGVRIVPEEDEGIKQYMKKRCPMNQVTVMFKKKEIAEVGGYLDWYCEEDYYLWIRLALANKKFGNIPENLVNVRVGVEMYQRRGGWKYFKSEAGIQKLMYQKKIINLPRYIVNIGERFILQVLLSNRIRSWIFQKLARN